MYAALGGLTDFSDLVDGIERGPPPSLPVEYEQQLAIKGGKTGSKVGSRTGNSEGRREILVSALDLYHLPFRLTN
jgi:hypothetical protein